MQRVQIQNGNYLLVHVHTIQRNAALVVNQLTAKVTEHHMFLSSFTLLTYLSSVLREFHILIHRTALMVLK